MSEISPFHRLGVKRYRQGSNKLWVTASVSNRIIGNGKIGATLSFASDLTVSVDTIEYWARAYSTFLALRPFFRDIKPRLHFRSLVHIRRELTISHFATMGRMLRKYEFSPYDAIEFLDIAATERTSARSMRMQIDGIMSDGLRDPEWVTGFRSIYKSALRHANDLGVPEVVRYATYTYLQILRDVGGIYQEEEDDDQYQQ